MTGLAHVTTIPKTGYATKVKVSAGHGYVAYDGYDFYRLYVVRYVTNIADEIIGAEVKYQKPFRGLDEDITFDYETLSFGQVGGTASIAFTNKTYVAAAEVLTDAEWLSVRKASTSEYFIEDAIAVEASPNTSTDARRAEIAILTHFGKKKIIQVNQDGEKQYLSLSKTKLEYTRYGGEQTFDIFTNYSGDDFNFASNEPWVKVSKNTSRAAKAPELRYIEGKPVQDPKKYANSRSQSITATVTVEPHYDNIPREAIVTVSVGQEKADIAVEQDRNYFYFCDQGDLSDDPYTIEAGWEEADYNIKMMANDPNIEVMQLSSDCEWLTATLQPQDGVFYPIQISCTDNYADVTRTGHITLSLSKGNLTRIIEVVQAKADMELDVKGSQDLSFNRHGDNATIAVNSHCNLEDIKVESNASWLTASLTVADNQDNENVQSRAAIIHYNLELSAPANSTGEERSAEVSVTTKNGKSAKLKITQDSENIVINSDYNTSEYRTTAPATEGQVILSLDNEYTPAVIEAYTESNWLTAEVQSSGTSRSVILSVTENPSDLDRSASIILESPSGLKREISLRQYGWTIFAEEEIWLNSDGKNYTYKVQIPDKFSLVCDADWITAYISADRRVLNITVSECNSNRVAIIKIENSSRSITVHQSKYKLGQTYNENGVSGTIYEFGAESRIARYVGEHKWATVTAYNGATSTIDGRPNTSTIKAIPNWKTSYPAFAAIEELNNNGESGWYFPALEEVKLMRDIVIYDRGGDNPVPKVWTSTEYGSDRAQYIKYIRHFGSPSEMTYSDLSKDFTMSVYATRFVDLFAVE